MQTEIIDSELIVTSDKQLGKGEWFYRAIEDGHAIIVEAVFTSRWALIEGYHMLGERIALDENFQKYGKGNQIICKELANGIGISERILYYAVQFYEKYPSLDNVPEGKNISWHKIVNKYLPAPKPRIESTVTAGTVMQLYKGDMLDILPSLGKFDLVLTDPPYGVTDYYWDISHSREWLTAIKQHLADSYNLFWFCSPAYQADTEMILRELRLPIQSRIVWHRRNMAMGSAARNKFIDTWEMIFHMGNRELNFPTKWSEAWFDVQTFAVPQTNFNDTKYHPTQKPIELIRRLIEFGSYPGDRIIDPFAGSGTSGAACPSDRECTLIEREEEYISIIEQRLNVKRF